MPTKINGINLQDNLMFICMQKNQIYPSLLFSDNPKDITNLQF